MTDNRTTELRISEPLRGFIRHQSNRAYIDGGQARWLTKIADKIDANHEQAIAATLDGGECEMIEDPPEVSGEQHSELYPCDMVKCSACGAYLWDVNPMRYCPNCGAKVVDA